MLTLDASVWVAAFDPHDRFHVPSVRFLRHLAAEGVPLLGPAVVLVEVACAVARRSGDSDAGRRTADLLRRHPRLALEPVSDRLVTAAVDLGSRARLRGADALYAAAAAVHGTPLVSWDADLIGRAGGTTPEAWLAAHG